MPRTARIAPKEFVYHVLTRGNNKQTIFKDEEDFLKYLDILKKYKDKYQFKLYHYVLMTNHVHLVIEPTDAGGDLFEIMNDQHIIYDKLSTDENVRKEYRQFVSTNAEKE
jgi:putative transposase